MSEYEEGDEDRFDPEGGAPSEYVITDDATVSLAPDDSAIIVRREEILNTYLTRDQS